MAIAPWFPMRAASLDEVATHVPGAVRLAHGCHGFNRRCLVLETRAELEDDILSVRRARECPCGRGALQRAGLHRAEWRACGCRGHLPLLRGDSGSKQACGRIPTGGVVLIVDERKP